MEDNKMEESAKQVAKDTGRKAKNKVKNEIKKALKKLVSFKKVKIFIVIFAILVLLFVALLWMQLFHDTAGDGEGENRTRAAVPVAMQEIVQSAGVSMEVQSTSASASAGGNSANNQIVSYSESGDGYSSITEVGGKTYRNYKQYEGNYAGDYYWGSTIRGAACGPTSVTIVLSGYKLDYSPRDVVKRMINEVCDGTNSHNLSKLLDLYGIDNERRSYDGSASLNAIRQNLSEGRPVIVGIDGSDGVYSSGGHWMVLLGEKDGTLIVSNPGRSDASTPANETLENFLQTQMSYGNGYILIKEELESSGGNTNSNGSNNSNSGTRNNNTSSNDNNSISQKIVKAAVECHKYLRENGYIYGDAASGFPGIEIPDGIYNSPRPQIGKEVDCSAYVSWVYYTAGYNTFKAHQENAFSDRYSYHNLKEVPIAQAQAGDIILSSGHVEIVAKVENGNITRVYNCGSDNSIQSRGTSDLPESSNYSGGAIKIFRPKELSTSENPIQGGGAVIDEDKMFFIGDSWMNGLKLSGKAKSPSSYFYAKGGENADWVLSNYSDMKSKIPSDVSCIVVGFGLNGRNNWPKTQELIDKLTSDYSDKNVFVLQTPHICDGYTVDPNFNQSVDTYNENMKNYCSGKNGVTFINPNTNIVSNDGQGYLKNEYAQDPNDTSMGGGKIHLNSNGYEVWYNDIASLIQSSAPSGNSASASGDNSVGVKSTTNISGHIVSNGRGGYKPDIDIDKAVEELIEKFKTEKENPLKSYLSDRNREEYLKAFLKAAIVTSYPDLRQKSEIGKPVPEGETQGIIKVVRKTQNTSDNSPGDLLQYIPLEQYNNMKRENNNNIFNYFTIDNSGQLVVAGYEKRTVEPQRVNYDGDTRPDEVEDYSEEEMYRITDAKINYVQQVEKYMMPFDLLWSLLVYSSDENLVYDLAKLVMDGEIVITVCDNITEKDKTDIYTFDKNVKTLESATLKDETQNPAKVQPQEYSGYRPDEKFTYTVLNKSYYESNNPSILVTYADTWTMKYSAKVEKQNRQNTDTTERRDRDDTEYKYNGEEYISESGSDSLLQGWKSDYCSRLEQAYSYEIQMRNEAIQQQNEERARRGSEQSSGTEQESNSQQEQEDLQPFELRYSVQNLKLEYKEKITNKNRKVTTVTTEKKYISQPGKTEGKVEITDEKMNFVKLLTLHKNAYNSLRTVRDWFFESMEAQESICDMVDLMKYLLQKAYNIDLGVEDFDFDEYGKSKFKNIGGANNANSGNLSTLSQYIAQFENDALRRYLYVGDVSYNSNPYIYMCITEDKKNYIMTDDLFTGNGNRNFGFGVCFWVGWAQSWNNVDYFAAEGINIKDPQYQNEGVSKLPVEVVNRIKEKIIEDLKNDMLQALSNRGITMEDYQVDALVNCRYRGAFTYSALDVYKQYGTSEQFKNSVLDLRCGTNRANANWILFTTGKYTDGAGNELQIY